MKIIDLNKGYILVTKRKSQGISVFKFFLLFSWLNLFFYLKKKKIIEKSKWIITKAVKLFEYKKKNKHYSNKSKLYNQVIEIIFPIIEIFYLRYLLLFLFNNAISHYSNITYCINQ